MSIILNNAILVSIYYTQVVNSSLRIVTTFRGGEIVRNQRRNVWQKRIPYDYPCITHTFKKYETRYDTTIKCFN